MPKARATKRDRTAAHGEILELLERLRVADDPGERFQVGSDIALAIVARRGLGSRDGSSPLDASMLDLALEALLAAVAVRPSAEADGMAQPGPFTERAEGDALGLADVIDATDTPARAGLELAADESTDSDAPLDFALPIPDGCEDAMKHIALLRASAGLCRGCGAGAGRCVELESAESPTSLELRFVCGTCGGSLVVPAPRVIHRNRKSKRGVA